jgi:hypothetical protein
MFGSVTKPRLPKLPTKKRWTNAKDSATAWTKLSMISRWSFSGVLQFCACERVFCLLTHTHSHTGIGQKFGKRRSKKALSSNGNFSVAGALNVSIFGKVIVGCCSAQHAALFLLQQHVAVWCISILLCVADAAAMSCSILQRCCCVLMHAPGQTLQLKQATRASKPSDCQGVVSSQ